MADVDRPHRLDEVAITERRHHVAALYLRRVTQEQIASKLGCSQQTVSADLTALKEQWKQEHQQDVEAVILRDLAELDVMEADCALQFAATHEVTWIAARLKIKERRAKLLGSDKPVRQEHTGPEGGPIPISEIVIEIPRPVEMAVAAPELALPSEIVVDLP